ncbi:MAG TPA: glycoside hydrolase family 3 C-terminal domain-containing protein [Chitinophaga sp.]|nr:glycoside hydrolase family 3 C-terminal domain-containing protein [Chitinophaga sp.]
MKKQTLISFFLLATTTAAAQTDYTAKAKELVAKMTLEEKAAICSGRDFWSTKPLERLGIPSIFMTDGPHGLRKSAGVDFTNTVPATCFPTAAGLASSWNPELLTEMGQALGEECQANNVQFLLGPGVNMKRSPLGGRNFEYFSEDPLLAGKMAAALIRGVQSQGVGTSLKHFAANNQEFERLTNNSVVDERTLHEIYLPAFEIAVKEAQPWTVMCSYNKLNGTYASENSLLLDSILRKQWGFKGFVVSDWGAVNNRPLGVKAGLNLEMPGNGGVNDKKIVDAVNNGTLSVQQLDESAVQTLALFLQTYALHKADATYDKQLHHQLARKISSECIVLLKNTNNALPLNFNSTKKIALIGGFAKTPRYQGAGSSQVNPTQISNVFDALTKAAGKQAIISYAQGYTSDATTDDKLIAEAQQQAKNSQLAVIFAGLPDSYESEGFDRSNMDMPAAFNRLIEEVTKVQPNTVVVLMNGSAVSMPWAGKVRGIVEAWLGGQAGGEALSDVLTGSVNPSGKLSETFAARLEDTPSYTEFPGRNGNTLYGEGIFIGYRYYDTKKVAPLFPFGYGLSYTTFAYTGIKVSSNTAKDTDKITVSVKVKNTGRVAGKEIVQLYLHDEDKIVTRPEKELKHFAKVMLQPGEETTVNFELSYRDFAYYDEKVHDWQTSNGKYIVLAGGSSASLPLQQTLVIQPTNVLYPPLTRNSMLKEFAQHPKGKALYAKLMESMGSMFGGGSNSTEKLTPAQEEAKKKMQAMMMAVLNEMPVSKLVTMGGGKFTEEMLNAMLQQVQ